MVAMINEIQYEHGNVFFVRVRINLPLFSTVVPASIFMFLSCRSFVAITTLSTVLVGVEFTSVSWLLVRVHYILNYFTVFESKITYIN